MKRRINIRAKVWKYPGPAGWYLVSAEMKTSALLKAYKGKRIARGYIPVTAKIGKTEWATTLFPSKEGPYLLAIKAGVRKKEMIDEGDAVSVSCALI